MAEAKLSSAEAELYDRQIRLWGIESQEKLRAANILIINIRMLGSEIAKDVLLLGINSLTILDPGIVTHADIGKNFLLQRGSVGEKIAQAVVEKAQDLNPLVKIIPDTETLDKKDEQYFSEFNLVIATCLTKKEILMVSSGCRNNKVKFICGDNFGMFGFSLADFQDHKYYEFCIEWGTGVKPGGFWHSHREVLTPPLATPLMDLDKVKFAAPKRAHDGTLQKGEKIIETVSDTLDYPEVSKIITLPKTPQKGKRRNIYYYIMLALLEFREKFSRVPAIATKDDDLIELKQMKNKIFDLFQVDKEKFDDKILELLFDEMVPICSIVGGVIAQEAIKGVSEKEVPIYNVFLLDPINFSGREERVLKSVSP